MPCDERSGVYALELIDEYSYEDTLKSTDESSGDVAHELTDV